jgi:hypothetical protein
MTDFNQRKELPMRSALVCSVGALLLVLSVGAGVAMAGNHVAHCKGSEEVPPVETQGQCQAIFKVRGNTLSYKLIVANLEDIVAAHIHCAPEGVNGPVGVTLFGGGPVTVAGILMQGPILGPNAVNMCGWADLDAVLDALESGDTYVNVHTVVYPGGEVRGQIR